MSIIQEALRKAQKTPVVRNAAIPAQRALPKMGNIRVPIEKPKMKNDMRLALYALLFLAVFSFFAVKYFSLTPRRPAVTPPVHLKNKPVPVRAAQPDLLPPIVEKQPVAVKTPSIKLQPIIPQQPAIQQEDFKLSGIMHLEDGLRAIINNLTVVEGDEVSGATVASITEHSVILKKGGSEITLRL